MKEVLENRFTEKRREHYDNILDAVAFNVSKTERLAIDCERDIDAMKKCEFMLPHLGETFTGTVSGLTNFGIFVELPNTVEGMISLKDLKDDHYTFDESKYQVIGDNSKKVFTFGQVVKVQLVRCNPEMRIIDFDLVK